MVNVKKYFLQKSMIRVMVDEYLAKQFYNAEYAGTDIIKTPIGTRVIIYAGRPAMIIGKGGRTIKQLALVLEKYFNLENPQITVTNVENPELNARVMAFRLAVALEKGYHFRRAAFITIRRIMNAGALGAEVIVSGKITSERAKYEKLKEGTVYKAGNSLEQIVDRAIAIASLKMGIYGVEVVIAKPMRPVDKITFREAPKAPEGGVTVTNVRFIEESGNVKQEGDQDASQAQ
ncbi:MAG: 30S ribosomal protein S3P [Candidatus Aramenus sulfurataquae]|jgi:small subunit ribosomal protein S3|uniref:Small ribosomal subunit protein uS3 n=2 Tax=Candidatus Aramenus sulfurataquae TaxID=1326980 RepID=W7KJ04_9CREN|nr:30S ribosomal protein S3P [Candidatus Aramenus sulfurataquae]EWG07315.1 MAG: 30S ribosomal protein S3P [Candidatus Aramenus sulfurataquae]MBW9140593.1 30S ribosomal protein S3 [Candidatus Aramenus sp.]MCL7343310.1 30S ribosomal protein S3 [Candidatus Aramenus sulfurataquae]